MTSFLNALNDELANLKKLQRKLEQDPIRPARATIVKKQKKNAVYYYQTDPRTKKRIYLGRYDSEKLIRVLEAAYKEAMLEVIKSNISLIENALNKYQLCAKPDIIAKLSTCVRSLNTDIYEKVLISDLHKWAHQIMRKILSHIKSRSFLLKMVPVCGPNLNVLYTMHF